MIILLIPILIGLAVTFQYKINRKRFSDAPKWTCFFK